MENRTQNELEKAKELFFAWRHQEAYTILRRFYDRLPFQQEKGHLEYISIFVRVLSELGKKHELKFYTGILETLYEKTRNPDLAYQLAVVYIDSNPPRIKLAKELLEKIVIDPQASAYTPKAKMALAYCYDAINEDVASCRRLIFSINREALDINLQYFLDIWKAKVLNDEKQYASSREILDHVLSLPTGVVDWYTTLFAKTTLAVLNVRTGNLLAAKEIVEKMKECNEEKRFKSYQRTILFLSDLIQKNDLQPVLQVQKKNGGFKIDYGGKSISIDGRSVAERLLALFLAQGTCDKASIVKEIYQRDYQGKEDDQLIYYHVNGIRKILSKVGLTSQAVKIEEKGYQLVPKVMEVQTI